MYSGEILKLSMMKKYKTHPFQRVGFGPQS